MNATIEKPSFYCHNLKDKKGRRVTICGVYTENTLRIGRATCSKNDQFNRKTGRTWSRRNALQNPEYIVQNVDSKESIHSLYQYIQQISLQTLR